MCIASCRRRATGIPSCHVQTHGVSSTSYPTVDKRTKNKHAAGNETKLSQGSYCENRFPVNVRMGARRNYTGQISRRCAWACRLWVVQGVDRHSVARAMRERSHDDAWQCLQPYLVLCRWGLRYGIFIQDFSWPHSPQQGQP